MWLGGEGGKGRKMGNCEKPTICILGQDWERHPTGTQRISEEWKKGEN